jgi:hypothetical protein
LITPLEARSIISEYAQCSDDKSLNPATAGFAVATGIIGKSIASVTNITITFAKDFLRIILFMLFSSHYFVNIVI